MTSQLTPCLSDEQWDRISAIFERVRKTETRGRPSYENRAVFERVLWVISNGVPWGQLRLAHRITGRVIADTLAGRGQACW
jgi:transposase